MRSRHGNGCPGTKADAGRKISDGDVDNGDDDDLVMVT